MAENQTTSTNDNKSGGVQELINKYINNVDEKGKLQLPDELSDVEKELIRQAKRTRDAQRALSKAQQEKASLEAKANALREKMNDVTIDDFNLTPEEEHALNSLKTNDPEKYRKVMNELEAEVKQKRQEEIDKLLEDAGKEALNKVEAENRLKILQEFRQANPDIQLTDEMLVEEVPPRFQKELNAGKYDFQTYLSKVVEYLRTTKVLPTPGNTEKHNLSNMAGGTNPGKEAAEKQGKLDYAKITF
jgi:ribosome-binding ATPase YchF (GTP1/OBG family)